MLDILISETQFITLSRQLAWLVTDNLGPVVQSIVSLTTSLRRHFVKYMPTTLSNPLLFFC